MKVAFVGNMNNWFFSVVRLLRDRGVDAHLFMAGNEGMMFHPSFDSFDLEYREYTHELPVGNPLFLHSVAPSDIRRVLAPYDFVVGCGAMPAYAEKAGFQLDVFWPYGSDLTELPFMRLGVPQRGSLRAFADVRFFQRRGIRRARAHVGMFELEHEQALDRIGTEGVRTGIPVAPLYPKDFMPEAIERTRKRSTWADEFAHVRASSDVLVYHASRQLWKSRTTPLNYKANDALFRGFANAQQARRDVRMSMICHEFGPDVQASKELCAELGIASNVHWLPPMARKDIMCGLSLADIAATEFANSWNFSGVIAEALAVGVPVMQHRRDENYSAKDLYPLLSAANDLEIFQRLTEFVDNPAPARKAAREAGAWFQKEIVNDPLARWEELFKQKSR